MATITAETIKELRERTQAGFMECKKALEEARGDIEQAITIIRKRGAALANKRASRSATEGIVAVAKGSGKLAEAVALFELNAETDFVAKNDTFLKAVKAIGNTLSRLLNENPNKPVTLAQIQEAKFSSKDTSEKNWQGQTVLDVVQQLSGTIGEKIELSRLRCLNTAAGEHVVTYEHAGNKIAAAVHLKAPGLGTPQLEVLGKDLAMQVVASAPLYLTEAMIPKTDLEKEKEVYLSQVMQSGKPKEIAEKIVQGKLQNFYKQACLIHQPFIKDPKISVSQYVTQEAKKLGKPIEILGFVRLACGEGVA